LRESSGGGKIKRREGGREGDVLDLVAHEEAHGFDALLRSIHIVAWRERGKRRGREREEGRKGGREGGR